MQGQRRRANPPYEQTWDAQSKHIYCHCVFHDQESVLKVVDLGLASVCRQSLGTLCGCPERDQEDRIDKDTQAINNDGKDHHLRSWSLTIFLSPLRSAIQASSSTKAIQDIQGASSPFRVQPTRLGAQAGR